MAGQFYLMWDGQRVIVDEFTIDKSLDSGETIEIKGRLAKVNPVYEHTYTYTQQIGKTIDLYLGDNKERKVSASTFYSEGIDSNQLARKAAKLELSEEDRLLRERGVIAQDGTLTADGANLLMQTLFKDNKSKVVDLLKQIDQAEAVKK